MDQSNIERKDQLEAMINSVGLAVVVHDLGEIALLKASRERVLLQNYNLAREWDKAAGYLFNTFNALSLGVS